MKNFERKKVKVNIISKKSINNQKVKVKVKKIEEKKEECVPENINLIRYVLDNSVIGKNSLSAFIEEKLENGDKIIITTLFKKGLENVLTNHTSFYDVAVDIFEKIEKDKEHFEVVEVDEDEIYVDDCVIAYCCDSKYKTVLVVASASRAAKARTYEVKHIYLNEDVQSSEKSFEKEEDKFKKEKFYTLSFVKRLSGELVIDEFRTANQYICLYSKDKIYNDGIRILHVGDEILVAMKKQKYINFCHYRVCKLTEKENCIQLYHKKIYNMNRLKISSTWYKDFLKDVKKILDL